MIHLQKYHINVSCDSCTQILQVRRQLASWFTRTKIDTVKRAIATDCMNHDQHVSCLWVDKRASLPLFYLAVQLYPFLQATQHNLEACKWFPPTKFPKVTGDKMIQNWTKMILNFFAAVKCRWLSGLSILGLDDVLPPHQAHNSAHTKFSTDHHHHHYMYVTCQIATASRR